ncbi:MAG: hypothetical protein ACPG4I_08255 [Candidatus Puniceispirillaceae bacterium]
MNQPLNRDGDKADRGVALIIWPEQMSRIRRRVAAIIWPVWQASYDRPE